MEMLLGNQIPTKQLKSRSPDADAVYDKSCLLSLSP